MVRMDVRLRSTGDADLDQLFEFERDPRAVAMAAFTRANPSDRAAFDRHYQRIRNDPEKTLRAIEVDGAFAGAIGSFTVEGQREVTYWIDPARWGRGLASVALAAFLDVEVTRHCSHTSPNTTSALPRCSTGQDSWRSTRRPHVPTAWAATSSSTSIVSVLDRIASRGRPRLTAVRAALTRRPAPW